MMNNTMTYKSYTACIEFDPRDNIFVGRVPGIVDIISFHGETATELTEDFHNVTPRYLADCKETDRQPQETASGKILLRMAPAVHAAAAIKAEASRKNLHHWASEVLERAADHRWFL